MASEYDFPLVVNMHDAFRVQSSAGKMAARH